jgi:heme exporter protein C
MIKTRWIYKILCIVLLFYALFAGLLFRVPDLMQLGEAIRNMFYHVGMWFSMIVLLIISVIYSIRYLKSARETHDFIANEAVNTALAFGILGILSGMVWAKVSWGNYWLNDAKLNGAAITILAYLAYKVLRSSVKDLSQQARIAAVYNILAFALMLVFMLILPRTSARSIHPGNNGNPAINPAELDNSMRIIFYPALAGWILLGIWILEIRVRIAKLKSTITNTKNNAE